jgi:hypothetical protein
VVATRTGKGLSVVGVLNLDVIDNWFNINIVVVDDVVEGVNLFNGNRIITLHLRLLLLLLPLGINDADTDSIIARMNSRHVMKKCRLLDKTLIALRALVAKLVQMTLDVVIHGVLACEGLVAALVAANKETLRVLGILNGHSFTG